MPVSEKKKASNAKWDKGNMAHLSCSIRKERLEAFRAKAAAEGLTGNGVLLRFIAEYLGDDDPMPPKK